MIVNQVQPILLIQHFHFDKFMLTNYIQVMQNKRKILLLPGDGIGPEVVREVKKIIEWFNKNKSLDFSFEEELIGGASIDANQIPITDEVYYKSLDSDAIILGA